MKCIVQGVEFASIQVCCVYCTRCADCIVQGVHYTVCSIQVFSMNFTSTLKSNLILSNLIICVWKAYTPFLCSWIRKSKKKKKKKVKKVNRRFTLGWGFQKIGVHFTFSLFFVSYYVFQVLSFHSFIISLVTLWWNTCFNVFEKIWKGFTFGQGGGGGGF